MELFMKGRKRLLASLLTLALLLTCLQTDVFADPAADMSGETAENDGGSAGNAAESGFEMLEAVEVTGVSRLDREETQEDGKVMQPLYQAEDMVTVIVELNEAPVMDYYDGSTYASFKKEEKTAGEAVSEFLTSAEAGELAKELLTGQEQLISQINTLAGRNGHLADDADFSAAAERSAADFEVTAQWTTAVNAFAVRMPYGTLKEVKAMPGVKRAYVEHTYSLPEPVEKAAVSDDKNRETYSYEMAGIDSVWAKGYTGKGMLVAVLDSGLDIKLNYEGIVVREHEAFTDESFLNDPADNVNGWELRYTNESLAKFLEDNQLISTTGSDGNKIVYDNNALYKNLKVPYACDYADGDLNVLPTNSDHGTHVSGTIAGFAKTPEGEVKFTGAAPDAQILFMKVFPDEDGGATESSIVMALEDSLKLGADLINLSLGSDNGYAVDDTIQNDTFARIEAAGIAMMTSAGNSAYSTANNNYEGEGLTSSPETSMMSSPAVYDSNLSIASIDGAIAVESYFVWTDKAGTEHRVPFSDPWSVAMKSGFSDKQYPIYAVGGTGTYDDYYSANFNNGWNGGKTGLALVKRGEISFSDKINNAMSFSGVNSQGERYGVLGVIIYDNDPEGTELIHMSAENTAITSAYISGKDGAAIVSALESGYEVKIQVSKTDQTIENETFGEMSSFTSWGAGPGLELKPEITAPGGNIWSSVIDPMNSGNDGYTGSYSMMSGTSMAAPHMTGIAALVRQYLIASGYPANEELGDFISRLLVSTAVPQQDSNHVFYSPRQQGAGLVNASAAVSTPAYLSVEGKNVGKLELLDDPEKKGVYDITFDVNNISNQSVTYDVEVVLMRPDVKEVPTQWGTRSVLSDHDVVLSTTSLGDVTAAPKSSAKFSKQVSLTEAQKEELNNLFVNGIYVEGYVKLTDKGGKHPQIGMPLLAFYGDWTKAPVFDTAFWTDEPKDGESVYNNESAWGVNFVGCAVWDDMYGIIGYHNLGQNIFDPDNNNQSVFLKENIELSPNGDGYFDRIDDYVLYQIRDARLVVFEVKDSETGELYFRDWASYSFKTTWNAQLSAAIPFSVYGTYPEWAGTDLNGDVLPSGTKCIFTITAYGEGDYGEEVTPDGAGYSVTDFDSIIPGVKEPTFNGHAMDMTGDIVSFPVTVDTVAPKLVNNAVSFYQKDGRTYISGTVYDEDGSLASLEIVPYITRTYKEGYGDASYAETGIDHSNPFYVHHIYDAGKKTLEFEADVTEYVHTNEAYPGENNYYDFTWNGNILLSCGDYGMNDRSYAIVVDTSEGIVLSQTSALLYPGSEFELSVNNNTGDMDAELTRTSSNPEVAVVNEYGKVTAIAPGQAVITVSNGKASADCVVAVQERHTEVEDFRLSIDRFSGLKPDGEAVVKVEGLTPADVQLNEIRWVVSESDEYAENYAEGLITVMQETSDGLSGSLYLNVSSSDIALPAGTGTLTVTLNGVSRSMEIGWDDLYTSSDQDGMISAGNFNTQVVYVQQGETAELCAKYRQATKHTSSEVMTELTGLVMDGADFFVNGSPYQTKLVNEEGYALPTDIHVYTVYSYGTENEYEYEMTRDANYGGYTYDAVTGVISIPYSPTGSSTRLKITAEGVAAPGNPAGERSNTQYTKPDGLYGPFDWAVTEGDGTLEMTSVTDNYGDTHEAALFTPTKPGVSYITASSKDGQHHVNFAVVSEAVLADSLELDTHRVDIKVGETKALNAVMKPEPTLEKDKALEWTSFNPSVATVDENGVIQALSEGYTYIKVNTKANNKVSGYCIVSVTGIHASSVSLDKTELTLRSGESAELTATILPADCTDDAIWTSGDDSVAIVDENGVVTAVADGETTVKVTAGSVSAECKVTVDTPVAVSGISLDKTNIEFTKAGETSLLTAAVMPENATNKNVSWRSSDKKIASVNDTGIVTAVSNGTCTITVTTEDGLYTAECKVTVKIKDSSSTEKPEEKPEEKPDQSQKPDQDSSDGSNQTQTPVSGNNGQPDTQPTHGANNVTTVKGAPKTADSGSAGGTFAFLLLAAGAVLIGIGAKKKYGSRNEMQ